MNGKEFLRQPAVIFIMLWGVMSVAIYAVIDQESDLFVTVSYIFYLGSAIISLVVLMYVFRFYGMKSFEGKVWLYMLLGVALWNVAEYTYFYYYMIEGEAPFPSVADIFYLAAYAPLIVAIVYKAMYAKPKFDRFKVGIIAAIVLTITIPAVIYVFNPVMSDQEYDLASKAVSIAYPVLDLILLTLALVVALYWGTSISKGWHLVALAMGLTTIADILNTGLQWSTGGDYAYINLLWLWQYLLYAAGALYQKKLHESFI